MEEGSQRRILQIWLFWLIWLHCIMHIFKSHYLYFTQQTVSCGVAPKIIRHRIQGRQRQKTSQFPYKEEKKTMSNEEKKTIYCYLYLQIIVIIDCRKKEIFRFNFWKGKFSFCWQEETILLWRVLWSHISAICSAGPMIYRRAIGTPTIQTQ